ncbi:MAG: hypothetical protein ACR2K3_06185 [Nocardioides sp.]
MSVTPLAPAVLAPTVLAPTVPPVGAGAPRRVRHQARDAVLLMGFSAVTSVGIASGFLLLAHLGR